MLEVVTVLHAAAAGNDDLGSGQFGTVGLGQLFAYERGLARIASTGDLLNRSRATGGVHGIETGRTHGDHLDRRAGLHGGDGVTSVDRALEGVRAFHRDDLGDLVDVQLRGNARQEILAVGGGSSQYMAVVLGQISDQRRDVLGQLVGVSRIVGDQYLGYAFDLCGCFADGSAAAAGYQHVDVATDGLGGNPLGGGDGVQGSGRGTALLCSAITRIVI